MVTGVRVRNRAGLARLQRLELREVVVGNADVPRLARLGHLQQCLPLRRPLLCAVPLCVVQQQQVVL